MKTILFIGGPWNALAIPGATIAQMPKDPDGTGTGFLLRLLGRDGALYTYHLKGNVCTHVSTIHSEASLQNDPSPFLVAPIFEYKLKQEWVEHMQRTLQDGFEVNTLLSDPRTKNEEGTP